MHESQETPNDPPVEALLDLFKYYREEFIPAYADLAVYLGAKPDETLLEIENILSHVARCFDPAQDEITKLKNVEKAKRHLERATLDCVKIIWVDISETLDSVNNDETLRRYCVNMPEHEFAKKYMEYQDLLTQARLTEMNSVGVSPLESVYEYKRALELGKYLIRNIDNSKVKHFKEYRKIIMLKTHFISFLLGFVASLLATWACGFGLRECMDYLQGFV